MQTNRSDRPRVLVVGRDPVAVAVARTVPDPVQFVGLDETTVGHVSGSVAETRVVEEPGNVSLPEGTEAAILAAPSDSANLLSAQRLRVASGDIDVVVRLNDPRNRAAFADLDVRTVCAATNVGESLGQAYARTVA